jgi:serine protease AprX
LLIAGCVPDDRPPEDSGNVTQEAKKGVVESEPNLTSECTALYSGPEAMAALSDAVVDPEIATDGSSQILILSINQGNRLSEAASVLTSALGVNSGKGLGVFENLPLIALRLNVTQATISLIKEKLKPFGLLSIYKDRPLKYSLHQSVSYIQADAARVAFETTGKGVGVAVIDSGIDATQGDFANVKRNVKIVGPVVDEPVGGYLYVDLENTDLTSGHGTHVASTIAGTGAESSGKYRGVAPGASLIGVGTGDAISILYALQGFDFVLRPEIRETHNVRVISNSWGTSGRHFAPYDPISIASKLAYDLGVVVLFAAGNEGPGADTLNPYSASPCVISVAAGDKSGLLADFSSRGVPGDVLHRPDITAPGVDIVAARAATGAVTPPYEGDLQYGTRYSSISGTSMATPHMSGVVALMLEVNPGLNLDSVLKTLTGTATPMPNAAWEVGAGYVNAFSAVQEANATAGARSTLVTEAVGAWKGEVGLAIDGVTASEHTSTITVPSGSTSLRIRTEWGNPALDLDLFVYGPSGELAATSAEAASPHEEVILPAPAAGTYKVTLKGWLTTPTSYTGTAERDYLKPL